MGWRARRERSEGGAVIGAIREFLRLEAAAGIILFFAAVLALLADNSPLAPFYEALLSTPARISVGAVALDKPLLLWINDGLMAIFFLLVGLEIKREIADGELSNPAQVVLPAVAALGGMAAPAAIYALVNLGDPAALRGWAIPAATDIAFALGVLSLLGRRVPIAIKVFLTAVAIFDDLGAIIVIAVFYTADLSWLSLAIAGGALVLLAALNLAGVTRLAPYMIVGLALWVCVLKSGVHATLAGVVLAAAIPLRALDEETRSPLRHLEERLHPWVAYLILPLFGFANAGVSFAGVSWGALGHPVTLGIILGLFVGKQVGIFGACWLAVRLGVARLPEGTDWLALYAVAILCGIGFTMSLFIGALAFDDPGHAASLRIGVLAGSLISAIAGIAIMRVALARRPEEG
ncbi:MAG TPA: Na+/H+ antiporter NhaA [Alphaproteobacteria bacterium]|nr:Na+/H+ antiporter NhaA [Alphaproteobacteria bacterium]